MWPNANWQHLAALIFHLCQVSGEVISCKYGWSFGENSLVIRHCTWSNSISHQYKPADHLCYQLCFLGDVHLWPLPLSLLYQYEELSHETACWVSWVPCCYLCNGLVRWKKYKIWRSITSSSWEMNLVCFLVSRNPWLVHEETLNCKQTWLRDRTKRQQPNWVQIIPPSHFAFAQTFQVFLPIS